MADAARKKLRIATVVYWILLLYIIAALVWWFISLMHQNEAMYRLKKEEITSSAYDTTSPAFQQALRNIEGQRRINISKYIGEGSIFLLLIIVGAAFIYRSVRHQFGLQLQQQNFMMAITHELKTPVAVSRLSLETLLRHPLDEEKRKKLMQSTLQETMRLDTLINNILVMSQMDAGAYRSDKEELNFSDLVADMVHQFQNRYPDRKVISKIEKDMELIGDPLLLKLLVSNLLENANKYSGRESPVTCTLSREEASVVLQVMDEGPGIADEEKKNIFRKFYRIGSEQTRKTQGTGLGLYLCKKIAAYHHAGISVKNNQPGGSNFTVTFLV
jgi:K+-sensing histidine kinase KdpD